VAAAGKRSPARAAAAGGGLPAADADDWASAGEAADADEAPAAAADWDTGDGLPVADADHWPTPADRAPDVGGGLPAADEAAEAAGAGG